MAKKQTFTEDYINDLEEAFQQALKNKNFASAIRAKELQSKAINASKGEGNKGPLRLENLTDKDIHQLISDLEAFSFSNPKLIKQLKAKIQSILSLS